MRVTLTKSQMSRCVKAGNLRTQLSRLSGIKSQKVDKLRADNDIDILGVKAELAVSLVFDVDFSLDAMGVDDGCDLFLHDIGIDVKSTYYKTGKMLFRSKEAFKADACILVTATDQPNEMEVVGWLSRKEFMEVSQESETRQYSGFAVEQGKLRPLSELWHIYKKRELSK